MTSLATPRRRLALAATLVVAAVLGSGAVAAVAATPGPAPTAEQTADPAERRAQQAAAKAERKAARAAAKAERADGTAGGRPRTADEAAGKAAAKAERKAARRAAPTGPGFVCDPALSHGQNVSAYARSLPKGPGRGRLVSQAARSDCGTTHTDD